MILTTALRFKFSVCYFWEKRQGYLSGFYRINIFPWVNLFLLRGWNVSVENFTPLQRLQQAVWRLETPLFLHFYSSTSYHLSSTALPSLKAKGTTSTPHQLLFFVPGVAVNLCPVLGTPWWKRTRAAVSDVRIALAPNYTGESPCGLWNSSGVSTLLTLASPQNSCAAAVTSQILQKPI